MKNDQVLEELDAGAIFARVVAGDRSASCVSECAFRIRSHLDRKLNLCRIHTLTVHWNGKAETSLAAAVLHPVTLRRVVMTFTIYDAVVVLLAGNLQQREKFYERPSRWDIVPTRSNDSSMDIPCKLQSACVVIRAM